MIWLQIMQQNVDEFNLAIYSSIVPGLVNYLGRINIPATHRSEKEIKLITSCINGQVVSGVIPNLASPSFDEENGKYYSLETVRAVIVF